VPKREATSSRSSSIYAVTEAAVTVAGGQLQTEEMIVSRHCPGLVIDGMAGRSRKREFEKLCFVKWFKVRERKLSTTYASEKPSLTRPLSQGLSHKAYNPPPLSPPLLSLAPAAA
jgi:hypothetical protein